MGIDPLRDRRDPDAYVGCCHFSARVGAVRPQEGTDTTLIEVIRAVIPYYIPVMLVVLLIIFFPDLTTYIPV